MPRPLSLLAALTASTLTLALAACQSNSAAAHVEEDEAYCRSVKPGVITTVNRDCAVVGDHPVDPAVKPEIWKGQEVGFCCEGCRPRWKQMSAAERDAALARVTPAAN